MFDFKESGLSVVILLKLLLRSVELKDMTALLGNVAEIPSIEW